MQGNIFNNASGGEVSDSECAELFNAAFASAFTNKTSSPLLIFPSSIVSVMRSIDFTAVGIVIPLIDKLKLSSSAESDDINSKFLKNTKQISAVYLSLLCCQSLSTGNLPIN